MRIRLIDRIKGFLLILLLLLFFFGGMKVASIINKVSTEQYSVSKLGWIITFTFLFLFFLISIVGPLFIKKSTSDTVIEYEPTWKKIIVHALIIRYQARCAFIVIRLCWGVGGETVSRVIQSFCVGWIY